MKRKSWIILLINTYLLIVLTVAIFNIFHIGWKLLPTLSIVLILNGIVLLFIGLFSVRKNWILSLISILLGAFTLFVMFKSTIGNPAPHPKGIDATIKAGISNIYAQAFLLYEQTGSFADTCSNVVFTDQSNDIKKNGVKKAPLLCFDDEDSFVVATQLKTPTSYPPHGETHYCADSTKTRGIISTAQFLTIKNSDTLCQ